MLAATSSHVAECPDLGPECNGPVAPVPYRHHIDLFMTETSLDAAWGVRPWLAVEARMSVRSVAITPTYSELDGTPKDVPNDIHHHDETLVGITDPWLVLRTGAAAGRFVTAARVGVTLPFGSTVEDPYALGARGLWHEHTQFGAGTVMPVVGGGVSYLGERVEVALTLLGFFGLAENAKGFRAPSRFFVGARGTFPLLEGKVRPFAAVDVAHEGKELWHGLPGLEGSFAQTTLLAGGGLAWVFADPWSVELGARARVARFSEGASFEYPGILQLAISTRFGP
jgi:hypothetical protein